jgi:GNAT superfamily N-acetyltransferase
MDAQMTRTTAAIQAEQMRALKPGTVELGQARLTIEICGLVAPELRSALREIVEVWTEPGARGLGHAGALMRAVCEQADQAGISLMVMPEAYAEGGQAATLDDAALAAWYARAFGFFTLQTKPRLLMLRLPHEAQPTESLANLTTPIASAIGRTKGIRP